MGAFMHLIVHTHTHKIPIFLNLNITLFVWINFLPFHIFLYNIKRNISITIKAYTLLILNRLNINFPNSNYRFQQIKYEIDPEYLFSPIRGEGKTERAVVEEFFKVNYTHRFNVGRITRPGKF